MENVFELVQSTEKKIDEYIGGLSFQSSLIDIRNYINWILSINQVDQIFESKNLNYEGNIDTLTSIYTYLKDKLNKDLNDSLNFDGKNESYNQVLSEEIILLSKYKMLFNILPLVYRGNKNIYKLENEFKSDVINIKYLKGDYFKYECFDILFTRISLMVNFNNVMHNIDELKKICDSYFSKDGFNISYPEQLKNYKKFVQLYVDIYKNSFYLLSDDFLYPVGEFGLEDFRKFIAGIFTINQFSNEMVLCFKYSNRDLIDNEEVKELLIKNIYNKKEKYEVFRAFFCLLIDMEKETFENVIKYFIVDFDKDSLDLSGDEFIVPFVKYDGYIYFNSIFNTQVINQRNLIYSMNNLSNKILKDSKYDNASKELELNFIGFMRKFFESYNLEFYDSKEWNLSGKKGEIDGIVVCKKNKKIMIIQTKTVVAASNYRTLFSLQDNMKTAIRQLNDFDEKNISLKNEFLSEVIGVDASEYEVFNCLNSEGGLGNALIWEELFNLGYIPFNINLMILYFERFKNLNNFKLNIYQLIEDLNKTTNPQLINCKIDFSKECGVGLINHDSTNANYFNLIDELKIIHEKLQSI